MKLQLTRELKIKLLQALKDGSIETDLFPEWPTQSEQIDQLPNDELLFIILESELQEYDLYPDLLQAKINILSECQELMNRKKGKAALFDPEKLKEYVSRMEVIRQSRYEEFSTSININPDHSRQQIERERD